MGAGCWALFAGRTSGDHALCQRAGADCWRDQRDSRPGTGFDRTARPGCRGRSGPSPPRLIDWLLFPLKTPQAAMLHGGLLLLRFWLGIGKQSAALVL